MAEPIREAGYVGQLISLAGVRGREGLGRIGMTEAVTVVAASAIVGLLSNPARLAASIQNLSVDDDLDVYFGDTSLGPKFTLPHLGYLQIDYLMPWTGPVYLYSAGTGIVTVSELSVQQ